MPKYYEEKDLWDEQPTYYSEDELWDTPTESIKMSFNPDGKELKLGSVNGEPTMFTTEDPKFPLIVDISEKKKQEWKDKGDRGWLEVWGDMNKLELIPEVRGRIQQAEAEEHARVQGRLLDDSYQTETTYQPLPPDPTDPTGFGMLLAGGQLYPHTAEIDDVRAKEMKAEDLKSFKERAMMEAEAAYRPLDWGGMLAEGVQQMVPMIGEFVMTRGMSGGKVKDIGKWGTRALTAGKSVATAPIRTTGMLSVVNARAGEREIAPNLLITDKGQAVLQRAEVDPAKTWLQEYGKYVIEVWSEEAGGWLLKPLNARLGKGMSRVAGKKATQFMSNLKNGFDKKTVQQVLKAGNFDGVVAEFQEERLVDVLTGALGGPLEDDPEKNIFKRIWNHLPGMKQMSVEAALFAIPGATSYAAGQITNRLANRGVKEEDIQNVIETLTAVEQENYIERDNVRIDADFSNVNIAEEMTEESESAINEKYNAMVEEGEIDPTVDVEDSLDQHKAIIQAQNRQQNIADGMDAISEKNANQLLEEELGLEIEVEQEQEGEQSIVEEAPPLPEYTEEELESQEVYGNTANLIAETFIPQESKKVSKATKKATNPLAAVMRRFFRAEALRAYGDVGKKIYGKVINSDRWSYTKSAKALYSMSKQLGRASDAQLKNFHLYVRGELAVPEELKSAVRLWRSISADIATLADKHGVVIKMPDGTKKRLTPNEKYFPDFISDEFWDAMLKDRDSYLALRDSFAKQNNITPTEADKILTEIRRGKPGVYGHLEKPKILSLPETITVNGKKIQVYERDPRKVLTQYIRGAYIRIGDAKEFGAQNEKLDVLYSEALEEGENYEEIRRLTQRMIGVDEFDEMLSDISNWARGFNVATKLSLGQLTNIADITKAFVRTNGASGFVGTLKAFSKEGKEFASQVGVTKAEIERYAKEHGLSMGAVSTFIYEKTGFEKSEEMVRRVAVNASRNYIKMLHKKLQKNPNNSFARRRLEQFGLDATELSKRGLNKNDYIKAATQMLMDSQPISRADAPYYWSGPIGKMATQFKQFAHKQARFTKKFVLDELMKGNFVPAFWMLVLSQALGEPLGELKAFVRGKDREGLINALQTKEADKILIAMFENLLTIGGIGLVTDTASMLTGYNAGKRLLGGIVGPTVSEITDIAIGLVWDGKTILGDKQIQELGKLSKKGKVQSKIAKKILRMIPVVGPALASQLMPTTKSLGYEKKQAKLGG